MNGANIMLDTELIHFQENKNGVELTIKKDNKVQIIEAG
jgi:hypothetical protein